MMDGLTRLLCKSEALKLCEPLLVSCFLFLLSLCVRFEKCKRCPLLSSESPEPFQNAALPV